MLIGAIAAVVLVIIFYPLIVYTPIDVNKVSMQLSRVALSSGSPGEQSLTLRLTLTVNNTNDITLTTSSIDYELFADGTPIGTDRFDYESVPVTGRPAIFPGSSVPLTDTFTLQYSDAKAEIFNKILNDTSQVKWELKGTANVESGTTSVPKEFSTEL